MIQLSPTNLPYSSGPFDQFHIRYELSYKIIIVMSYLSFSFKKLFRYMDSIDGLMNEIC